MKYEKPKWELMEFKGIDIITQSNLEGKVDGSGDDYGGNGEYPWE